MNRGCSNIANAFTVTWMVVMGHFPKRILQRTSLKEEEEFWEKEKVEPI